MFVLYVRAFFTYGEPKQYGWVGTTQSDYLPYADSIWMVPPPPGVWDT